MTSKDRVLREKEQIKELVDHLEAEGDSIWVSGRGAVHRDLSCPKHQERFRAAVERCKSIPLGK